MRLLVLLALVFLPLTAQAQHPPLAPLHHGRPSFATYGAETMPQLLVDEAALGRERYAELPFPAERWAEVTNCVAALGYRTDKFGEPPAVLLVPVARTIRVRDLTVDSLRYAEDTTWMGQHWSAPTVGYALVRSGVILATEPYRENPYLLRHEALHFLVWRLQRRLGHPPEFFQSCDAD